LQKAGRWRGLDACRLSLAKSGALMRVIAASLLLASVLLGPTAFAQDGSGADVSGAWHLGGHQDTAYVTAFGSLVDYGGIPLNEAGRLYALAWEASRQTLRTEQCAGYVVPYAFYSPGNYRFWEERDPHTQ